MGGTLKGKLFRYLKLMISVIYAAALSLTTVTVALAGPEESYLKTAQIIFKSAEGREPIAQREGYEQVRMILNKIVEEFPSSNIAVRILLKDNLDGLDVKALDAALATPLPTEDAENTRLEDDAVAPGSLETSEPVMPLQVEPAPSSRTINNGIDNLAEDERGATTAWRMATEADQKSLSLNNRDVREVQGRLTALSLDPKGIDGSVGPGTRAAIAKWQLTNGIPATGYLDGAQLLELKATSQAAYSNWLQIPSNRRLVEPPPPIALGPNNVSGVWTFVSRCGPRSRLPNQRINGVLNIIHSGNNNYTGRVRNSQGLNGNFSGTLRGRNLNSQINWGLLFGRVQMTGRIADNSLTLSGRDSNGCSITARKQ